MLANVVFCYQRCRVRQQMKIGDAIKNSINKFTNEKMKAAFGGPAVYT